MLKKYLIAVHIIALCANQTIAAQKNDSFENYSVGEFVSQGSWIVQYINQSSTASISTAESRTGSQSLHLYDGSTDDRPVAFFDSAHSPQSGRLDFSVKAASNVLWRLDVSNKSSSTFNFSLTGQGGSSGLIKILDGNSNLLTSINNNTAGYSDITWNDFSVVFDNAAKKIAVYLNGASTPILTSSDNSVDWVIGRVNFSVGYNSGTGQSVYYDDVSLNFSEDGELLESFETLDIGALDGQGNWSTQQTNGSSAADVSSDTADLGQQSLQLYDGSKTNRPIASIDAGYNIYQGVLQFSVQPTGSDLWRVDCMDSNSSSFNFSIIGQGNPTLGIQINDGNGQTLDSISTSTAGYDPYNWNRFTLHFDQVSGDASLYLNDSPTALLSLSNSTANLSIGKLICSVGYNSGKGQEVYFDDISIQSTEELTSEGMGQSLFPEELKNYLLDFSSGNWSYYDLDSGSTATITPSPNSSGINLQIEDNSSSTRPRALYDFGTTIANGRLSFAVTESSSSSFSDVWRIDFHPPSSGSFNFSLIGQGNGAMTISTPSLGTLDSINALENTGYYVNGTNYIDVTVNEVSGTIAIYLNGNPQPILQSTNASANWSFGEATFSTGYGSGMGHGATWDSIWVLNYDYQVDFESQTLGNYTLTNVSEDFPNTTFTNLNGLAPSESVASRASIVDQGDSRVLEVSHPTDGVGLNGNAGISFEVALPERMEYYFAYNIEFKDNGMGFFDWIKGGKLPGFAGGSHPSGGNYSEDGFSSRYMWTYGGSMILYAYWIDQNGTQIDGMHYGENIDMDFAFEADKRYEIVQRVKMNTPGLYDGAIQTWINGKLCHENLAMRFRKSGATWMIDQFYFVMFYGGNNSTWAPPNDNTTFFDNIRIWHP
ncbi:polysaccharide lyase [Cerasicoccus maritimus]|uniref:polysaccharide lyase n=1 Tax=Cerasicoccus maritimus TaxID=490089 RepID=UPI00285270E7|nr:hypothetical protein [Cerasicoccus maritimus]